MQYAIHCKELVNISVSNCNPRPLLEAVSSNNNQSEFWIKVSLVIWQFGGLDSLILMIGNLQYLE